MGAELEFEDDNTFRNVVEGIFYKRNVQRITLFHGGNNGV